MKRRLGVLITVAVTVGALFGTAQPPAGAAPLSAQPFSGYSTGTQVSTNLLTVGETQVANVQEAFAGASVDSEGLTDTINNEMGQAVQPPLPDKNSYGRGAGAELGLVTNNPAPEDLNQLILSGLAEAAAPPPQGPIVSTLGPIDVPPVLFASLLQGTAQAIYNPDFCPIGKPLSYGKGEAANVQVLPTGSGGPGGLINTGIGSDTNTANSRSFEYFAPNGDGTFGLVSETHQHLVPIGVGAPVAGITPLTIQVDGDFIMRLTASGKPGRPAVGPLNSGASIEFNDPLVTVTGPLGLPVLGPITMTQLLGAGLNIPVPPIATITAGGPPRAIGGTPPAAISSDGTSVAAAYDLIRIALLTLPGLNGLDLRIGHMEGAVTVPPGGITCDIPISKTASVDPVTAGNDVTISINIPRDVNEFNDLYGCDLVNIKATSTESAEEGVRFEIVSADHGGVIDGNVITWDTVGNYHPGDPPIVLSFVLRIPANSGIGTLEDIANVTASLGNCTGGIAGQDLVGNASLDGSAISGSVTLTGPKVSRGNLAATGEDTKYLLLGGAMLFGAVAVMGVRRRLRTQAPTNSS